MRSSEILRKSRQHLWAGAYPRRDQTEYICYALDHVVADHPRAEFKAGCLKREIANRLYPYNSVFLWLLNTVPNFAILKGTGITEQQLQAYRHRWVDHLIAEYEAAGD